MGSSDRVQEALNAEKFHLTDMQYTANSSLLCEECMPVVRRTIRQMNVDSSVQALHEGVGVLMTFLAY